MQKNALNEKKTIKCHPLPLFNFMLLKGDNCIIEEENIT